MDDKANAPKDTPSDHVSLHATEPHPERAAPTTSDPSKTHGSDSQDSPIESAKRDSAVNSQAEESSSSQPWATPPRVIASASIKKDSPSQAPSPVDPVSVCPFQESQHAQEEDHEPFSDYSTDTASLTTTINSLNYQYHYENGRRYHAFGDAAYLLPNDEREQERLEGQHQTWLMILGGKLHLAPLDPNIQNVLDVATGTGNWAMDFADEYPSARVFGTDLSPIQPNLRSVPPNCTFLVEDSEKEWLWDERFDFIHSRTLGSAWRDWPGYFKKCYEFLKPGGWLELHEFTFPFHCADDSAGPTHPMMLWSQLLVDGAATNGVDMLQPAHLDDWLRDAGFTDVTRVTSRLPFTGWSDDPNEARYGEYYGKVFDWGVSMAFMTSRLGWSRERAEVFVMEARRAAGDPKVKVYIPLYMYTARKPETAK